MTAKWPKADKFVLESIWKNRWQEGSEACSTGGFEASRWDQGWLFAVGARFFYAML